MPYKKKSGRWERAKRLGHVAIIENELVQQRLERYRILEEDADFEVPSDLFVSREDIGEAMHPAGWAMSFDGSSGEVSIQERFPSTRMCYAQVAGVLVNLGQMKAQGEAALVDPATMEDASDEALFPVALPGSNVCDPDMPTVKDSWRAEIYETFRSYKIEEIPLLQVYMLLVRLSGKAGPDNGAVLARCTATPDCEATDVEVPSEGVRCDQCGERLFPTDALRIHEEVAELQSNATALTRLMLVLEHISMISYLYFLYKRQPRSLANVAFIMDGPLALFGPPSWLHTPIQRFISRLCSKLEESDYGVPLILGLEKSGSFAEHAAAISEHIPSGHLMQIPEAYIRERILTTRATSVTGYGEDNFYGKRFFYKTKSGATLTMMMPKPEEDASSSPEAYSRMADALALLDEIGTSLYEDAVIPIALAHSFAAIPLRTGSKVLRLLSEKHLE